MSVIYGEPLAFGILEPRPKMPEGFTLKMGSEQFAKAIRSDGSEWWVGFTANGILLTLVGKYTQEDVDRIGNGRVHVGGEFFDKRTQLVFGKEDCQ